MPKAWSDRQKPLAIETPMARRRRVEALLEQYDKAKPAGGHRKGAPR